MATNHMTYIVPNTLVHGGPLDHANLNTLQASISELWLLLSYCRIQDSYQTMQLTWHLMHLCVGDHQTT